MHKFLIAPLIALSLAGCGVIYKVDVYQGSLLREENVDQLRPGLTKRQVVALLGSPAIDDPFHQSRWDYISAVGKRGADPEIHNLVLTFDGDTLASIDGKALSVDDLELMKEMRKYPNLPREDKDKRGR
jgi:outer membrane protein assembly factor BamE